MLRAAERAGGEPRHSPPAFDLDAALQRLGYATFRAGQREAIETLLGDGRLLLVAPTGGGKSLVYQLPATLLPGTTIVISPLISLMRDQSEALARRGVPATFFSSTIDAAEMRRRLARAAAHEFKLIYVAPERLVFPGFRRLVGELSVPLVAVDEAHCISEWGHDFRPEYLQIGELLADLPQPRVLACTATATPVVRDEILARLGLPAGTPQIVRGFARPNLILRAREIPGSRERAAHVDRLLSEALGRPGRSRGVAIVYTPTRLGAEEEAARLAARGWRAVAYHAGMEGADRDRAHEAFAAGAVDVVAATIAFGMGIDRPDVRAVVHLAPPGSVEEYYQEVGRAGRDGAPAWGLLLVAPGDMPRRRRLIERAEGTSAEAIEHKWNLYLEMMRWIEGGSCRHDAILRYFGDEAETLAGCGHCDVCEAITSGRGGQDEGQATLLVRKVLSGVARISGRFGMGAAIHLLHGSPDPRLRRSGLDRVPTYGVLRDSDEPWLLKVMRRCVTAGWIDVTAGDRPVARLTDSGRAVMKGERPARLLLPPAFEGPVLPDPRVPRRRRARPFAGLAGAVESIPARHADPAADWLFEALREHRLQVAREQSVPAYFVASDRTLRDMAEVRPRTSGQLASIFGMGPARVEKYGRGFLDVIARHAGPEPATTARSSGST